MKRRFKCVLILGCCLLMLSGCFFKRDTMEDIDIYTTIYSINYLVNCLYSDNAKIYSIYPGGVDIDTYELSDKRLTEYSKSDLFVFNSLDRDRDYAVDMINKNPDLKVIDVSLGMNYTNSVEELWLNPYNYLMMAQNLKTGLNQYITNPYLLEEIDANYEDLQYDLSKLDATLKETINNASYKTIVTDNKLFKFLEKYNLTVLSLDDSEEILAPTIDEVEKLINDGKIKYIYSIDSESNDIVKGLLEEYDIELVTINAMDSIDGGITNSNESYLTVMNSNIELLNKELYK